MHGQTNMQAGGVGTDCDEAAEDFCQSGAQQGIL